MTDEDENENDLEPLESFEDFGPDDLELVRSSNPPPPEEDEWSNPVYEKEQKDWRDGLLDQDRPDPYARVVSMGEFRALVFEWGEIRLMEGDTEDTSFHCPYFDPNAKTDAQVREKYKKYRTFS